MTILVHRVDHFGTFTGRFRITALPHVPYTYLDLGQGGRKGKEREGRETLRKGDGKEKWDLGDIRPCPFWYIGTSCAERNGYVPN